MERAKGFVTLFTKLYLSNHLTVLLITWSNDILLYPITKEWKNFKIMIRPVAWQSLSLMIFALVGSFKKIEKFLLLNRFLDTYQAITLRWPTKIDDFLDKYLLDKNTNRHIEKFRKRSSWLEWLFSCEEQINCSWIKTGLDGITSDADVWSNSTIRRTDSWFLSIRYD